MRTVVLAAAVILLSLPATAPAQTRPGGPAPRRPAPVRQTPAYPAGIQLRGFGTVAVDWFTASSTFGAVLGSARGTEFGGGLSLTEGPGFLDIGARRFKKDGERVFVGNLGTVFPLGIPTTVTMTPLDVTIGWRLRPLMGRRLRPYVGGGYTRLTYEETAGFAQDGDDVSESFNGYHVLGGGEFRFGRLVGVAAEVAWTSIANAIGEGGASKAFDETNLGGTSARFKVVIGR
ncbi:MAG: hypothetical protein R2745_16545 [Vicinamibacterales bacterium]